MNKRALICLIVCLGCQAPDSGPEPRPTASDFPGSDYEGPAFEFERITDNVYQARGTGNLTVGSNAAVIINDEDVLLVDSHVSPVAAAALLDELASITDKPVRYVVDSHFHFDHAHGNQIYGPDVEVIGHEFTRQMLMSDEALGRTYQRFMESWADRPGFLEGQEGLVPTPPTTTLSERMTLHKGGTEIRLLFFGRGHTGGDIVVHLPEERILITGDLLLAGVPYMGDGFPADWPETLEELKGLDFDLVLPGHGPPFSDLGKIDSLQDYLRDLWAKSSDAYARGLSAEAASEQIDMTNHAVAYPNIRGPGAPLAALERIYELLDAEGANRP